MVYDNDIFISYAHIDNETLTKEQQGWITAFHHALEVRLGQLLGKKPRIFRDPKLQGNDVFGDRLVEALPKTATLISIFTPRYVRSEWCVRELDKFIEASERSIGLRLGSKSRIFKIVKTPIPLDQHPQRVQDLLGYEFFSLDPETGRPRELSQDAAPEEQRAYWAKLNDIAYDLCDLLTEMESLSAAGAPKAKGPKAAAGVTVFLAEASYDLREQRSSLLRFLQQQGHTVLPDQQLPLVVDECEAVLREQLAASAMSIHLFGANYGIIPEGTTQSLVALQNELAIARGEADAGFQRLIWIPPQLATQDERQQKLLADIRNDARIQQGADILETPLSDLQIAVEEKLRPPAPEATTTVYVAQTSFELNQQRLELIGFLKELGHAVLPQEPLPLYADGCEKFLGEQLAQCTMSIHMIGDRYGVVPENTQESFITLQAKMARRRRAAADRFRVLVWIPPGLAPDDERQQRFIAEIRADPRGAELVEEPLDQLEAVVAARLKPPANEEEPAAAAVADGPAIVYLICDQRDQEETSQLEDVLFDHGFEVVLPLFEGDETEIRQEHEESLKSCDVVIIYYGAGNEAWQRRMLREVKKSAGYGRTKPPPAAAIYVAPPETPQKQRLRTHEALVLQPADGFSAADLKPLLDELAA